MKQVIVKIRGLIMFYLKFGWPLLIADVVLSTWFGEPLSGWRQFLNTAAFAWVLCAPIAPISFLFNRARREKAMARVCGLQEGDERERTISGEASRFALLLTLAIECILLVFTLVSVHVIWNPNASKEKRGLLAISMSFDSTQHLNPFGVTGVAAPEAAGISQTSTHSTLRVETASVPQTATRAKIDWGGTILSPRAFLILLLLILAQLSAFRIFALKRYAGNDA